MKINHPLMKNNLTREDLDAVIKFLEQDDPILTQSSNVQAFEDEWSDWLDVKYSVYVNSGSSANLVTIAALKYLYGAGEIIVPRLLGSLTLRQLSRMDINRYLLISTHVPCVWMTK